MDMNQLFGKFSEMQEQMKKFKEQLDEITVEGEAGGGMVTVTCTGNSKITKVKISDDVMDDKEMLEDLVCAATNKAMENAENRKQEELKNMTQGMMPPGMDLSQLGF
jgi:DNA-binding YbaB/EbfC family protein